MAGQIEAAYRSVDDSGYLRRSFSYHCVDDAAPHAGLHGTDLRIELYLRTRIKIEYSIAEDIARADAVSLFTIIEFIYDHTAKPRPGLRTIS
ncbi:MAG: hypothetical protein JO257_21940 [Deltaproteobacteria bacterium]|nr:hypothetical protein [Deltaproteobacteria bacterium]